MSRPKVVWLSAISGGIVLLYVLGVVVRGSYGIAVSIHNHSGEALRDISLRVESQGKDRPLGDLANEERLKIFVQPRAESHIVLQ